MYMSQLVSYKCFRLNQYIPSIGLFYNGVVGLQLIVAAVLLRWLLWGFLSAKSLIARGCNCVALVVAQIYEKLHCCIP